MSYISIDNITQIITKKKGREIIMSAPLEKLKYWAENIINDKCDTAKKEKNRYFVKIMNNSIEINVLSQLSVLTLFNDTCVSCGKQFTHYALIPTFLARLNKKCYNMIPVRFEKSGDTIKYELFTKDHIIPQSKYGENRLDNYQFMCSYCNNKKGSKFSYEDEKYGIYKKGIFKNITAGYNVQFNNKLKTTILSIEQVKGGLFYITFENESCDGYYEYNGKNIQDKNKTIKICYMEIK